MTLLSRWLSPASISLALVVGCGDDGGGATGASGAGTDGSTDTTTTSATASESGTNPTEPSGTSPSSSGTTGDCPQPDADQDGEPSTECGGADCDDSNPQINPSASDPNTDGTDQNCDGVDGPDGDGDGYPDEGSGGDDCNDDDETIHPGANELWMRETVDSGDAGWNQDLALDDSGGLHVVYSYSPDGVEELRYAARDGVDSWTTETLHENFVRGVSLDIGTDGTPHIAATANDTDRTTQLMYLTTDGNTWSTEVLTTLTCFTCNESPTIVVADDDSVRIAYGRSLSTGFVAVWSNEGGTFAEVYNGPSGSVNSRSISLRSDGVVELTAESVNDISLRTDATGSWQSDIIIENGGNPSLGIASNGSKHVAYSARLIGQAMGIRYANEVGGWQEEEVDTRSSNIPRSHPPAIAIGPDDAPHIAYDWLGAQYCLRVEGEWNCTQLSDVTVAEVSLVVTDEGVPWMTYSPSVYNGPGEGTLFASTPDDVDHNCNGDLRY